MKSRIKILPDGREKCIGYQWEKRVGELKERAKGFCEAWQILPGHASHFIGEVGDPHHRIKRSIARDDRLSNLLWICHKSHEEIHGRKF